MRNSIYVDYNGIVFFRLPKEKRGKRGKITVLAVRGGNDLWFELSEGLKDRRFEKSHCSIS